MPTASLLLTTLSDFSQVQDTSLTNIRPQWPGLKAEVCKLQLATVSRRSGAIYSTTTYAHMTRDTACLYQPVSCAVTVISWEIFISAGQEWLHFPFILLFALQICSAYYAHAYGPWTMAMPCGAPLVLCMLHPVLLLR